MTKLFHLFSLLCLLSCKNPNGNEKQVYKETAFAKEVKSNAEISSYKVIGIKDGDTFVVLMDGREQVIRLEHIDCPEKKQPFGTKAKQFASDLCFGKFVTLNHKNKFDRNKRLLAEIILLNGINVNKELVRNGLAWHFKKYSKSQVYATLEIKARKNQIGIWSEANPVAPWEWRKKKKKIKN